MKRYEVQLFSDENLVNAVAIKEFDSIILALDRFTDMCESGHLDYNLDKYYVWLYDRDNYRYIIYYTYVRDGYSIYEELTPGQY